MNCRILSTITLLLWVCSLFAQFQVTNTGGHVMIDDEGYRLDAIVLFNGIDASTSVEYTGGGSVVWSYAIAGEQYSSTQKSISPEHGVLYTLTVGGQKRYHIYTVDYTAYPIELRSIEIAPEQQDECQYLSLLIDATVPAIEYTDSTGTVSSLSRMLTLDWIDASLQGTEWADSTATMQVADPSALVSVNAPKQNTTFSLSGDDWAEQLGLTPDTVSIDYNAVKVECHTQTSVIERQYLNEKDRSSDSEIEGSGPLVVEVISNANPIDVVYYEWFVASVETPDSYQRYSDANLNYTFEKTGEYKIKLTATSNTCQYSDSINVRVIESYIEAPNIFTPNGDGMNDEWRVAYKSIERYSCIVQNRWGRTVFKSDNPGKGWDGMIGGRPASEGTYYYVIIAYGTDVDTNGKQKKYRLSGDINLLR